jgi:hypothetical protein
MVLAIDVLISMGGQSRKGTIQLLVQIGDLMVLVGLEDAVETEETVLPATRLQTEGLDGPALVLLRLAAQPRTH